VTVVRAPAVAGRFYPDDPAELRDAVESYLAETDPVPPHAPPPRALILPHAGYVYSGPVAASGYARLRDVAGTIDRIVLLGPSHHVPVAGLAYCSAERFATPLGAIPVDTEGLAELARLPFVERLDAAHAREHSLEVHLPFLQVVLGEFTVLPLVVGNATPEQVAAVLRTCERPGTLPVISSDLSHYHDYATAVRLDRATADRIVRRAGDDLSGDRACGCVPIAGLLSLARERDWSVRAVDVRNSGDTAGPRDRVVGYGAFVLTDEPPEPEDDLDPPTAEAVYSTDERRTLLEVARWSIRTGLDSGANIAPEPSLYPPLLRSPGATFVTLRIDDALRGCMGTLRANAPLVTDVAHNAFTAAFRDPRFTPLSTGEYRQLAVEVSVLGEPRPFPVDSEADLLERVRPGIDGLILVDEGRRGTLLPTVWESIPDPAEFVQTLKRKAGLPAEYWSETLRIFRYTTESFGEG
jgi:MEMO1 family protein